MKIIVKNGMTNSNATGLLRVKVLNMDDNESIFLEKSQGNTVIISEGTNTEEERSIGNISAFDEDGDRIFYHTLSHCSKHDGRYRIDKRSGEIFVTAAGVKNAANAAPSQLCILASSSSDFDPSLKQEHNSSADNQLGIKIYQAEQRTVVEQLTKLVKEFGNNSVINLEPNAESTILSSSNFANRVPSFLSFKLNELEFVSYSQKSIDSKKILTASQNDLVDVDSTTGDLRIDPKIYSMDEGIYTLKIDVNFRKISYETLLTKQIHVLSSENRLKFVFDEPVSSMALNLQLFKNKTEETISSVNPGIQLILMQPQVYSSKTNRVYLERQSTKGPSTESSYSNGKTRPANSPFAVPQFIDARKITSSLDY
ncbi:CaDHerin family [Ditylenchus destructor]|nr:CaDHerin family [Ditylenchus destructor]